MRLRLLLLAPVLLLARTAPAQLPVERLYEARSPNEPFTSFGEVLAPFADADADGTPDFLVSASAEIVFEQEFAGRVYLVSGATGAILRVFDGPPVERARFGWSAAATGDLNADGTPDVVVGAFLYPGPGEENFEGRVYLLSGATGAVLHQVAATKDEGRLGTAAVGLDADLDGDGVPDVFASQPRGQPALVVASGATGAVIRDFGVVSDFTTTIGQSLVVVSDLTGDGVGEVAVGGPNSPGSKGGNRFGRVYVVDPATGDLVYAIANPAAAPNQDFGGRQRLAAVGDLDGDGITDLAVGSTAPQGNGFFGATNLFSGATGTLVRTCLRGGRRLAPAGDLDGDGVPDVLSSGRVAERGGVIGLSGATCEVLFEIESPFVTASGFPTAITAVREAIDGGEALVAVGAAGSLPGETETVYRVFVYRVGGTVAQAPEPSPSALAVSVSPVPSVGAASAWVSVPSASSVRVSVVDALGREVSIAFEGALPAGRHRRSLPAGLAAGVYAVRVTSGASSAAARWVVAR